ncbi:trithorax group protein osa isoform X2 [Frankliniella occidentalis]|uniref:Trithorax group protein osa isoform X2 n=1 Tax=Frankliniella occidentalis TaxID=133901 RepID=A0A6J1S0R3_FRAOC|nr:trithorax group protein osa isoform X2 [Frankliniella occidentalis]
MCATLHVLWSLIYITCGAVQLVVGIFFLVAKFEAPFLRLGSNVLAGGWNVVVGVTGALVACVGPMSSPGRHEALLYMAVSVLAMNAVNLAVLEIVEWKMLWTEEHQEVAERTKLTEFLMYARIGTSAAAAVAMLVSFLDSQLTFCSLQHAVRKRLSRRRSSKGAHGHHGHHGHGHHGHHHDHPVDSEYIILPRVRPSTKGGYEQYTRSWVFDVDGNGASGGGGGGGGGNSARYQQLDSHSHADKCRDAAAAAVAAAEGRSVSSRSSTQRGDTYTVADAKALRAAIANGGPPPDSSPAPSGPSGSKQYNRQQKHKELMREREHQKQLREQQHYQQRSSKDARPRPTSTSSAASSGTGGASPASSSRQQQQHQHRQQQQQQPVIEESPPSGTSPDSPAVDSAESRSPDSGEQAEQDGGLGTALGTAHGLGPSLRQGSARMRPLRIVIDAGSSDPVASRQCVFLQTFSRTPSPGASPAHSPCPPRPSAPVPGQVPAMLGFAQFSGRGQEPNREGEDPPLNECLDRLARGPVRRPSVQDHASPRTSPTSSSRPARPLSAGSGNGACSEQVGYHSLMSELTQVIRKKPSPKDDTSSADFNRQLEAALQDIHDLDSSTGGTLVNASSAASSSAPPPPAPDWGDSDDESSASSRTVGKRRSHPRLGRAFAIPVPPPVPPPHADGTGTLRGTLRATRTGTLTNTLRRQWDRELQQLQQQRDSAPSAPSPEPPPPPPLPLPAPSEACEAPLPQAAFQLQSPVRSKTVVTIYDGDMVVREMNNNDIVFLPVALPLPPELDELPPAPPAILLNGSRELPPPVSSPSPSPPPSPSPTSSPLPSASHLGDEPEQVSQGCSMGSVGRLGGLSLLRKGRSRNRRSSSGCGVRLSQELQGAVLQSESLVFLTDSELVARHERNRRVQREIEQRVQQQISGHSGSDSLC